MLPLILAVRAEEERPQGNCFKYNCRSSNRTFCIKHMTCFYKPGGNKWQVQVSQFTYTVTGIIYDQ